MRKLKKYVRNKKNIILYQGDSAQVLPFNLTEIKRQNGIFSRCTF